MVQASVVLIFTLLFIHTTTYQLTEAVRTKSLDPDDKGESDVQEEEDDHGLVMVTIPSHILNEPPLEEDKPLPKLPEPKMQIYDSEDRAQPTYFVKTPAPKITSSADTADDDENEDNDQQTKDIGAEENFDSAKDNRASGEKDKKALLASLIAADNTKSLSPNEGETPSEDDANTDGKSDKDLPAKDNEDMMKKMYEEIMQKMKKKSEEEKKMAEMEQMMSMMKNPMFNQDNSMNNPMFNQDNSMFNPFGNQMANNPMAAMANNQMASMSTNPMAMMSGNPMAVNPMASSMNSGNPMQMLMMQQMMKNQMTMGRNPMMMAGSNPAMMTGSNPMMMASGMSGMNQQQPNGMMGMNSNPMGMMRQFPGSGMGAMGGFPMRRMIVPPGYGQGVPGQMAVRREIVGPDGQPIQQQMVQGQEQQQMVYGSPAEVPGGQQQQVMEQQPAPEPPQQSSPMEGSEGDVSLERKVERMKASEQGSEQNAPGQAVNDERAEPSGSLQDGQQQDQMSISPGQQQEQNSMSPGQQQQRQSDYEEQMYAEKEREVSSIMDTTPVPSLEESDFLEQLLNGRNGQGNNPYGIRRRAKRYRRPKFLVKASIRKLSPERLEKSKWLKEPSPEFCHEAILVHDECDHGYRSGSKPGRGQFSGGRKGERRWSFSLEDGTCLLYNDPCPQLKRNSFTQLSQCIATCWRQFDENGPDGYY